jgi:hypothetical protein
MRLAALALVAVAALTSCADEDSRCEDLNPTERKICITDQED